eukprot:Tbor_TRINITY_DN4559_c0_g1::TRINITY_DN4559_c0_g1_i2::g.15704::m.15704
MSVDNALRRLEAIRTECVGAQCRERDYDEKSFIDVSGMGQFDAAYVTTVAEMKRLKGNLSGLKERELSGSMSKHAVAREKNIMRQDLEKLKKAVQQVKLKAKEESEKEKYKVMEYHYTMIEKRIKGYFYEDKNRHHEDNAGTNDVNSDSLYGTIEHQSNSIVKLGDLKLNDSTSDAINKESVLEDAEFKMFYESVRRNDRDIAIKFDQIHDKVLTIKEKAWLIQQEIKTQEIILDDIENKVDSSARSMKGINRKLKKTLKEVGKDRMCIYFFCCILLCGVVGMCIYMFAYR